MSHLVLTPGQQYIILMAVSGDLMDGWVPRPTVCKDEMYNVTTSEEVAADDNGLEGRAVSVMARDEDGEYQFGNDLNCKPEDKGVGFRLTDLVFTAHFSSLSDSLASTLPFPKRWRRKHILSGQTIHPKSLA